MNTGIGRVTRLVILSATGVLSFAVYLFAQTNDASRPKPKQESPEPVGVVCKESTSDSTQQLEVLSDTMGVDFGPYLSDVRKNVRHNWYSLVPESATWEKGTVTIGFRIVKDGSVAGMKLAKSSGNDKLDRAAWGGITGSDPFQPLPVEFKGSYLALCFNFFYNPGFGISPPGPMKIPAGTTQQFSTGITEDLGDCRRSMRDLRLWKHFRQRSLHRTDRVTRTSERHDKSDQNVCAL